MAGDLRPLSVATSIGSGCAGRDILCAKGALRGFSVRAAARIAGSPPGRLAATAVARTPSWAEPAYGHRCKALPSQRQRAGARSSCGPSRRNARRSASTPRAGRDGCACRGVRASAGGGWRRPAALIGGCPDRSRGIGLPRTLPRPGAPVGRSACLRSLLAPRSGRAGNGPDRNLSGDCRSRAESRRARLSGRAVGKAA